jgi:hypothetical protein
MRESRSYGSVRGAISDGRPYRNTLRHLLELVSCSERLPADYPFHDPLGVGLCEVAINFSRSIDWRAEHGSHNYLAIKKDGDRFAYVLSRSDAHFLSPRSIELNHDVVPTTHTKGSCCGYVAIGNDDFTVEVNRTVRFRYSSLAQSGSRLVFSEPNLKANRGVHIANDRRQHSLAHD